MLWGLLVAAGFVLGWFAGCNTSDRRAYAALWEAVGSLPDPAECALCSGEVRYHAPCLVDLSTGEMGELKVYQSDPACSWEIAPIERQPTGTFHFQPCTGLLGVCDTGDHTCKVTLPKERKLMNPALFCKECRVLLTGAGLEGYVVVDLYDLAHIRAYPVYLGESGIIRVYRFAVTCGHGDVEEVCVTGLL